MDWGDRIPTVSAILVNGRGEVLLQLRDHRAGMLWPGHWTIPGGHVEAGESPDDAIRREMIEEMELGDLSLRLWTTFDAPRGDPPFVCAEHIYTGRLDVPAASIRLHEGQRVQFFEAEQIDGMTLAFNYTPLLRRFFAQGLHREVGSGHASSER